MFFINFNFLNQIHQVHVLLHLFVTANKTFTFIGFHCKQKSERSLLFKNIQFNLSCWMEWLFCRYSVLLYIFELFTFWPLVITSVLNSWTLPFCDQIKEEFTSLNFIFELLNFRPIWIYNFWTFELFLYLNV